MKDVEKYALDGAPYSKSCREKNRVYTEFNIHFWTYVLDWYLKKLLQNNLVYTEFKKEAAQRVLNKYSICA